MSYLSRDLSAGLVAYYPFDGSANDASGNGNTATLYNTDHYVTGHQGQAVYLTGRGHTGTDGDYVMIPSLALDTRSQFSISMWVKHDGYAGLLTMAKTTSPSTFLAVIRSESRSGAPRDLHLSRATFSLSSVSTGTEWGDWVLHSLTWSNGTLRAYKNGVYLGSQQAVHVQNASEGGLGIHWFCSGGTVSTRFIGGIDDVRIYNCAL